MIRQFLDLRFRQAMTLAGIPDEFSPHITVRKNPSFGGYQANGAMAAAKALKQNPRALAASMVDNLDKGSAISSAEVAGPGFINISLSPVWLGEQVVDFKTNLESSLQVAEPQTVVVDYSSPNLAKEMHVGHLRSTIIGDCLVRVLEAQGHRVIRQNHVGDWGTQFGMLLQELENFQQAGQSSQLALSDLERFYQQAKRHFDESAEFADQSRQKVVLLQSGDPATLELWREFRRISLEHSQAIYRQLNVRLQPEDVYGESAYNADLPGLVETLKQQQLAVEDDGAVVVFLEELKGKDDKPSPVIVRKQGGGYLYATTDLAALRYRCHTLKADRILYFIDARQSLHMKQVFLLAQKAQLVSDRVSLEHHAFGTMMSKDGKPFKTRSGGTVKLADLLAEAVERAEQLVRDKNPDLTNEDYQEIAKKVGVGSLKYADLCKTRTHDYRFDWESMLSFEGNTAPYLQYAYTRIQSVFRKADLNPVLLKEPVALKATVLLLEPIEKQLAIQLLQFPDCIEQVAKQAYPHILCAYLYELASVFMSFYESCPILKTTVGQDQKNSRLMLCDAVANTMKAGLGLLGIEVMERM